jgi:subtilase family serine protease
MHKFAVLAQATGLGLCLASSAFGNSLSRNMSQLHKEVPDVVGRSLKLGHSNPNRSLHVAVSLPFGDQAGMEAFVNSVSDPRSPNYRNYMTPEQIGANFGLSDDKVQAVADYLKGNGFKINLIAKNHLNILADCTVAQAEKAFGTTINEYQVQDPSEPGRSQYFSFSSALQVPATIAPFVVDVSGLESFTKPHRLALTPTQGRVLYNLAPMYNAGMQGQGRTVAISNWDGYRLTNVPLYYSHFGLPTPAGGVGSNIHVVSIDGFNGGTASVGAEGDLDIQMVLGMAPLCNLYIYDNGGDLNSDLIGVLTKEVNDNLADVISESYGWNIDSATATSAHNLHVSMSGQGITYMAASGDSGTSIEPYSYPDWEPEVLLVGGTIATTDTSGNRTSEVGWSGSGGGWSLNSASFNVLPSWQHGTGVPTGNNHRLIPDVGFHASSSTGAYQFYLNGSLSSGYIGTSFASPVTAGSLAVAEQQIIANGGLPANGAGKQRFGRMQDLIYSQNQRSDVWLDITSGTSNGTLPDGSTSSPHAGWDFETGWGPINWNAFVATQGSPTPDFSMSTTPSSQTVTAGSGTSYTTSTAGINGFAGTISLSVSGVPSGASASFSPTSVSAGGSATLSVNSGTAATGTYTLTVTGTASTGTHTNTVTLVINPVPVPDFSMSTTPSSQTVTSGGGTSYTTSTAGINGFAGTISLSVSGVPAGASASFSPTSVSAGGSATLSVNSGTAATGTYTLTITGTASTGTHTNTVTLVINPVAVPNFTISVSPSSRSIKRGRSTTYTVTITPSGGFTGTVSLSVSGIPSGDSGSFSPSTITTSGSSTLTVNTTAGSARGTFTLTITGTSGTTVHSTTATLTLR